LENTLLPIPRCHNLLTKTPGLNAITCILAKTHLKEGVMFWLKCRARVTGCAKLFNMKRTLTQALIAVLHIRMQVYSQAEHRVIQVLRYVMQELNLRVKGFAKD
jgi:hypothetical protein